MVANMGSYSMWKQRGQSELGVNNSLCMRNLQHFTKPQDSQQQAFDNEDGIYLKNNFLGYFSHILNCDWILANYTISRSVHTLSQ